MNRKNLIKVSLLALALLAASWGTPAIFADEEDHGHEAEEGAVLVYELIMDEFSFHVEGQAPGEPLALPAGERVRLIIRNEGKIFHEAMFGFGVNGDHGYLENFFQDVEVKLEHEMSSHDRPSFIEVEVMGLMEIELDAEMTIVLEFTVPEEFAGRVFEIGCFVVGHYEAGMLLPMVIEEGVHDESREAGQAEDVGHEDEHDDDHDEDISDRDGDGVPDDEDYCPTYAGEPLKNGC